uniref:RING-type domain-containing protein n=1 Tax=Tetranychus urticae TaxID=32264 RepID=T1K0N9_TETUR
MDIFQDFQSNNSNPLIVFDQDDDGGLTSADVKAEKIETKNKDEDKLKLDYFEDQSLAQDYVCKICQFIVVDPREHNTGAVYTCTSLFCYNCILSWIKSGKSYCPSPGCLTSGFDESAFREIGSRDTTRLNGLKMKCPFSCGSTFAYSDYIYLSHRVQCPANPANLCKICKSTKTNPIGVHDCRIVFNEMRQKIESLNNKVVKLNGVIDQLRRDLEISRKESNAKGVSSDHVESNDNKQSKKAGTKGNQQTKIEKSGEKLKDGKKDKKPAKNTSTSGSSDNQPTGGTKALDKTSTTIKEQKFTVTFFSNNYLNKPGSSGINLIFHYGDKSFNFDEAQVTLTFRTFRSLLTDMMGHEPGLMLLIRHRVLQDKDVVKFCGFQPGNNVITIIPNEAPNYSEPGYKLHLFSPKSPQKAKNDDAKQNNLINFYSNNMSPQPGANRIKLILQSESATFMTDSVKLDRTIGDIRNQAKTILGNNPTKMIFLSHLILEDNLSVNNCDLQPGTTDITLLPPNFQLKYGANGALHLNRFLTNKSHGVKSNKANSLASLPVHQALLMHGWQIHS